ncbi:CGNR zinc finger domain-containing protein [Embleya sp. NPDC001921]
MSSERGTCAWGQCAAPDCADYFIDTGRRAPQRYRTTRCATRVRVATHRANRAGPQPHDQPPRSRGPDSRGTRSCPGTSPRDTHGNRRYDSQPRDAKSRRHRETREAPLVPGGTLRPIGRTRRSGST